MKMYCCRSVSTVLYFVATSTFTGLTRHARCSLATLVVIVALNSCVRRSRGISCAQRAGAGRPEQTRGRVSAAAGGGGGLLAR